MPEHFMKAAQLIEFGKPFRVVNVPVPVPEADEVLLRVEACGVCHSDVHIMQRDWPSLAETMKLPATLGHEVVGTIAAKGSSVQDLEAGDRVGIGWLRWTCGECDPCRDSSENLCLSRSITGVASPGGYAEYMRAKATHVVRIPEGLRPSEAAPYFCAGVTMYHAVRQAQVQPGQHVAIFGVGGLGHLAVQFARVLGARVTAVDVVDEKLALARTVGAHRTLRADDSNVGEQATAEGRVQVAIVTAPRLEAYELALRCLGLRGKLVVVGIPKQDLTFFADDLVNGELQVIGSAVGTRDEIRAVLDLAARGEVRCSVEQHPLSDVNEALRRVRDNEVVGRASICFP